GTIIRLAATLPGNHSVVHRNQLAAVARNKAPSAAVHHPIPMTPIRPVRRAHVPSLCHGSRAPWLALVLFVAIAGSAAGAPVRTPHLEAELIAGNTALVPGA